MAITRTQFGHNETGVAGTTLGVVLTGVAAASLVVCSTTVDTSSGSAVSSVKDDLLVAAVSQATSTNTGINQLKDIWYFKNYGGGTRTFTQTVSVSVGNRGIVAIEYAGADTTAPADGTIHNEATSATPTSLNVSPNPSVNGTLIVGGIAGANQPTFASPFGEVFQDTTNFGDVEDFIQTSAAAIAATWTMTSGAYSAVAASFKPAASAAAGGGSWTIGTRRTTPGRRGPFDPLGFLLSPYKQYSYVPVAVAVATGVLRMRDLDGLSGMGTPMKNPLE